MTQLLKRCVHSCCVGCRCVSEMCSLNGLHWWNGVEECDFNVNEINNWRLNRKRWRERRSVSLCVILLGMNDIRLCVSDMTISFKLSGNADSVEILTSCLNRTRREQVHKQNKKKRRRKDPCVCTRIKWFDIFGSN